MARSARALVVELVADTKDFVKGTQEADDALAKFSHQGARSLDAIEKKAKETSRDIAHGETKQAFGEAGSEVGNEFATNLGSSLASGDLTAIAQDTAGGLVGAFSQMAGPFGLALAPLAAIATKVFSDMSKRAQQAAERINNAFTTMTEDVNETVQKNLRLQWLNDLANQIGGDKGPAAGFKKMQDAADKAGISFGDMVDQLAEGPITTDALVKNLDQIIARGTSMETSGRNRRKVLTDEATAAQKLRDMFKSTNDELMTSAIVSERWRDAVKATEDSTAQITKNLREAEKFNRQRRRAGLSTISPAVQRR